MWTCTGLEKSLKAGSALILWFEQTNVRAGLRVMAVEMHPTVLFLAQIFRAQPVTRPS